MMNVEIDSGYRPGLIGRVTEMHARYYAEHWHFGAFFEGRVATELASFIERYDARTDQIFSISIDERIEASVTIDGMHARDAGAHLRWFIISSALRGRGCGHRLLDAALDFCRAKKYRRVYLETFAGLDAARHLYERAGFVLVETREGKQWGTAVTEQRFEARIDSRL